MTVELSEWEQTVLDQLKIKTKRIPKRKLFRIDVLFKSKYSTYVHYISTSIYCTDVEKAFENLVGAFRDSRIIDFDIDSTDEAPPLEEPIMKDDRKVRKVIDDLAKEILEEIQPELPSDVRDKRDKVSLRGSIISIYVRVVKNASTYDFLGTDNPSVAIPLANFLYQKGREIGGASARLSIVRAKRLRINSIARVDSYVVAYLEPLW